jgi:hypothetical protein
MTDKTTIKQAIDKAYKEAGSNAYFGNGFEAGVAYSEAKVKELMEENERLKMYIRVTAGELRDNGFGGAADLLQKAIHPEKQPK